MNFKAGDLFQTTHNLIGEIVQVLENDLEVFFLVPDKTKAKGKIWVYKNEWDTIPKKCVEKHIDVKRKKDYVSYYKELGFRPMTEKLFIRTDADIEKDEDLKKFAFPTDCIDTEEQDEYDFNDGFTVQDGEAFTIAEVDNDFVKQVHQAVNDYNKWEPQTKKQLSIKNFIDNMELKYSTQDDDKHFKLGESVDYKNPPMAPRASKRHKSFRNK
jgi:hypothetical protein